MNQQQQVAGQSIVVQGRIVWTGGKTIFEGAIKKDDNDRPILNDKGETILVYPFGLAVPKSSMQPGQINEKLWAALQTEALSIFPSGIPGDFAWKYKDGDGVDHKGNRFDQRKGYAGCIVLTCSTEIAPKFFRWENGGNMQIAEGIKCGDYVEVALSIKGHPARNAKSKAGLYLNPNAVRFLAYGEEIVNGPSADTLFGAAAPTSAVGGSMSPIGVSTPTMPSFAGAGQQQAAPQSVPQMPGFGAPAAAPTPHHGVLPPQFQQQQAAPQSVPQMPGFGAPAAAPAQFAPTPNGFPPFPGGR